MCYYFNILNNISILYFLSLNCHNNDNLLLFLCIYPIMFISCRELQLTNDRETQQIMFESRKFESIDEFFDRDDFKNDLNRTNKSFDDHYHDFLEKLDSLDTEDAHTSLLEEYSDIIKLEDETYTPLITNVVYRKLINRIYIVTGIVHKVMSDNTIAITDLDNLSLLNDTNSEEEAELRNFTLNKYQFSEKKRLLSSARVEDDMVVWCDWNGDGNVEARARYWNNNSGCKDDRKAWIRGRAYFSIAGGFYEPGYIGEVWGEKRSAFTCNWSLYKTTLQTKNNSVGVEYYINTVETWDVSFPDYSSSSDESDHQMFWGSIGPEEYNNGTGPYITLKDIHGEVSSRGIGSNWAILDCTY